MKYAHSLAEAPVERWQPLETHLVNVAEMTKSFASVFGAGDLAYLVGLLHDAGKYSDEFQCRLLRANDIHCPQYDHIKLGPYVDHATYGAKYLHDNYGDLGKLLSYAIAGHPGGMPSRSGSERRSLKERLSSDIPQVTLPDLPLPEQLTLPPTDMTDNVRASYRLVLLARMIYSCLVDADFLDTEQFMSPERAELRVRYPEIGELVPKYDEYMRKFQGAEGRVNACRREIWEACLARYRDAPGFFSMTVPTGGGKTLTSLGFGLHHAKHHGLRRIIYTMPFTSIIDQNAQVLRDVLGEDVVLEHHCNATLTEAQSKSAENWDTPVVVTTIVQLFDSLMSNRPSRTRKLHNIAGSVLIFDEAQAVPPAHLIPYLAILRDLVDNYGCTVVFCTATQPALTRHKEFPEGLSGVRELIPNPQQYFDRLRRVSIQVHNDTLSIDDLVEKIQQHHQCLTIVNTRALAREIYEALPKEGAYHLSASMCPAHRVDVLAEIHSRVKANQPCRIVSTQLIEAGVDIDLPVVYRQYAGIDNIAQAAGRCNRHGKRELGQVHVVRLGGYVPRYLSSGCNCTRRVIRKYGTDLLSPKAVWDYYRQYYWQGESKDETL